MSATKYDDDAEHKHLDIKYDHSHYIGTSAPHNDHIDVEHGHLSNRVIAIRGDWYAVHTH